MTYLCECQPNGNKALIQLSRILLRHAFVVVIQSIIVIINHILLLLIVLFVIVTLGQLSGNTVKFKLLCKHSKRFCSLIKIFQVIIFAHLLNLKLVEDALGDKIENMVEALCLVGGAREVLNKC